MSARMLDGVRILDFSRVLAVPMATQILGELGAEVIKIERPGRGDETRTFEPLLPGGESGYFFAFNRAKKSVTLDLKSPRGVEIARELAATTDVVMENFLPGHMESLGLGFETLSAANEGLVYVSTTGFGQQGPLAQARGYDTIFQALSGITALTGNPDGPPAKAGIPVADMTSGLWAVIGALAGLVQRNVTGKGRHIDVAMMDVQLSLVALAAARLFAYDEDPQRVGTEHAGRVPSGAYECSDGEWLQISCSDQHWLALCDVLGLDDLAETPTLATNAGRVAHRDLISTALRARLTTLPRPEVARRLRRVGVPVGEVRNLREALADENTAARTMVGRMEHPVEGCFPAIRTPLRVVGEDPPPIGVPPLLGADTQSVLQEALGLDEHELELLRKERVI